MFRERAADWVWNGEYDRLIREKIMMGDYDREVLKRVQLLSEKPVKKME